MKAKETALMLIEFQNDFCKEGGKLYDAVKDEIKRHNVLENAVKLLTGAREKGVRIVHIPFLLNAEWSKETAIEGVIGSLRDGEIFVPGTWGAEIVDELKPREDETILQGKRALNGFVHTNLADVLASLKVKNIGVAGFLTNVCAQATAMGAYDRGYRTRLITDACGATSEKIQRFVEDEICPLFGGKPSVDDFLSEIEA